MLKIQENETVELKRQYIDDIKKEIIAFANTLGGTIYIGVDDTGNVIGLNASNLDSIMLKLSEIARDSILPDILPFLSINSEVVEDKHVIVVHVSAGVNRPYYLKEKGLKPNGVYKRIGTASVPVSADGIVQMINQTFGQSYELTRSLNQDLSFEKFTFEMRKVKYEVSPSKMTSLQMIGDDGLYTNLALLLSDQCPFTIKLAVFGGIEDNEFLERREFSGSLLKQQQEIEDFISLNNHISSKIIGMRRVDKISYKKEIVREALLNSIVHRDYSVSASNIINIYKDRIEFLSQGGFVDGMDMESMFLGTSRPRNEYLAAIFYRLGLIENYGYGVKKINSSYEGTGVAPDFKVAKACFKVTLPNLNIKDNTCLSQAITANLEDTNNRTLNDNLQHNQNDIANLNDNEQKIIDAIKQTGAITRKEVEELLNLGKTSAFKYLSILCNKEILLQKALGRNSFFVLNPKIKL